MLNIQPKTVRGPEIFSRFLGESEKKIRVLFSEARHDGMKFGDRNKLQVIIFDELDSIYKRRPHCDQSIRNVVQDSFTIQLFTKIDELTPIDNILTIGTTNVLEGIEPALLHPDRIEPVIEVSLPDEDSRIRIFDMYTKDLLWNGLIESDVDNDTIVRATHGETGAHLKRIVRWAMINAMRRDVLSWGRSNITEEESEHLRVCNIDFKTALCKVLSAKRTKF